MKKDQTSEEHKHEDFKDPLLLGDSKAYNVNFIERLDLSEKFRKNSVKGLCGL